MKRDMRSTISLLLIMALLVAACSGSDPAESDPPPAAAEIDWIAVTGTDPLLLVDDESYRQTRTLTVSGPGAGAQAGTLEWVNEITTDPALRLTIGGDAALRDQVIASIGGTAEVIVVDDRVWAGDGTGTWDEVEAAGSTNPLFGPYASIVESMLGLVAPASDLFEYVSTDQIDGRSAWRYGATEFGVALEDFDVPVTSVDAWVDTEAGFLSRARIVTDTDDLTIRFELVYEADGFADAISITPPG